MHKWNRLAERERENMRTANIYIWHCINIDRRGGMKRTIHKKHATDRILTTKQQYGIELIFASHFKLVGMISADDFHFLLLWCVTSSLVVWRLNIFVVVGRNGWAFTIGRQIIFANFSVCEMIFWYRKIKTITNHTRERNMCFENTIKSPAIN